MTTTKLVNWGNGQAVRLSKADIEQIGIRPEDPLEVSVENGRLIIVPVRKRIIEVPDYDKLFAGYHGPQPREDGFSTAAGEEA